MKFISLYSKSTPEDLLTAVSDNNFVNENVKFADDGIKPLMKVKEKNGRLSIKCEMIGGPSKDNGFIVGTFFAGKIKECKGGSKLSGIILTAPIYHFIVFAFILWVVYRCIVDNAINILPIFILAFDILGQDQRLVVQLGEYVGVLCVGTEIFAVGGKIFEQGQHKTEREDRRKHEQRGCPCLIDRIQPVRAMNHTVGNKAKLTADGKYLHGVEHRQQECVPSAKKGIGSRGFMNGEKQEQNREEYSRTQSVKKTETVFFSESASVEQESTCGDQRQNENGGEETENPHKNPYSCSENHDSVPLYFPPASLSSCMRRVFRRRSGIIVINAERKDFSHF